jgi:murein DD-endopeptidase MepM/ murein hydrolase activator NlpD
MFCPVDGPVEFTDTWGAARSGGRTHKGVDMMADHGTPTVAPVSGEVQHRGSSLGGLSWYVYGDNGNMYYGTHLQAYANQGAGWVEAGTVIGYVGSSGNASASGPHLHFEIHPGGGAPVNPYPATADACFG